MHSKDGVTLIPNMPFTLGGEQYPGNWLELASADDLLEAGVVYTPDPPPALADIKTAKLLDIDAAYMTAIQQSVPYMGSLFQADNASQDILLATLTVLTPMGGTPAGFWWKDQSNNQIPMTLAQLQGLAQTMFSQGWAAFQNRDTKKAQANAATDAATVNAVAW